MSVKFNANTCQIRIFLVLPKKSAQIDLNLLLGLRRNVSRSSLSYFERAHQPEYERLVLTKNYL